jgi:transposase
VGADREAFSSEIWDWVVSRIPRIASQYPDLDPDDLAAELQLYLLSLRRDLSHRERNWKPYLIQCLKNRALRLVKAWRKHGGRESSFDNWPVEPAESDPPSSNVHSQALYRQLGNADRRLLTLLRSFDGYVSRLARHLGLHRNTIHRRLRQIRRTRGLFEIESAPPKTTAPQATQRPQLEILTTKLGGSTREIQRASVILDLMNGLTYKEIVRRRRTSMATIARWRARFAKHGLAGLRARHPGRKPSRAAKERKNSQSE